MFCKSLCLLSLLTLTACTKNAPAASSCSPYVAPVPVDVYSFPNTTRDASMGFAYHQCRAGASVTGTKRGTSIHLHAWFDYYLLGVSVAV
jgi:hypothetical protein